MSEAVVKKNCNFGSEVCPKLNLCNFLQNGILKRP